MELRVRLTGETAHTGRLDIHDEVIGLDALDALLAQLEADAPRVCGAALYAEANAIMSDSLPLCPLDKHPLRASGHVQLPEVSGSEVSIEMGYGGVAVKYALRQHEELSYRHPTPGTQAKYLEQPLREHERGMPERLAQSVRDGFA